MPHRLLSIAALAAATLGLFGCAATDAPTTPRTFTGNAIEGVVHGGQQPVTGSHVHLLQATQTGYGNASANLLTSYDGTDGIGPYVLSDSTGSFSITGKYTCTTNTQAYLLATGGNPGLTAGTNNAAISLMAALGNCPGSNYGTQVPYIFMNEVTTVATVYSLGGFMTAPNAVSSTSTTQSILGLANAFANVSNIVNIATGLPYTTTAATSTGTVPVATIYTLADILASCINTSGTVSGPTSPTTCYTLFQSAPTLASVVPSDTATALLNIVHNPAANVSSLYGLVNSSAPFQSTLPSAPSDWTIAIPYTLFSLTNTSRIAVDAGGNVWLTGSSSTNTAFKLSPQGTTLLSLTGTTVQIPVGVVIDPATGNAWVREGNYGATTIFSNSGSPISTTSGYSLAGAFDSQSFWTVTNTGTLDHFSATSAYGRVSGAPYSPPGLTTAHGYAGLGITSTNSVWLAEGTTVGHYSSTGTDLTGGAGIAGNGLVSGSTYSLAAAIDRNDTAWFTFKGNVLSAWDHNANPLSGSPFTMPVGPVSGISVDGANTLWIGTGSGTTVGHYTTAGALVGAGSVSGSSTYTDNPVPDPSGNLWTATGTGVAQLLGVAYPTANPISMSNHGVAP